MGGWSGMGVTTLVLEHSTRNVVQILEVVADGKRRWRRHIEV